MRKLSGYGPSLIVLATGLLVLFIGPSAVQHLTYKETEARMVRAANRLEGDDLLARINLAYEDVATVVEPSVVHISAQQRVRGRGNLTSVSSGSGWIFDDDGHVVTNLHVVKGAQRIEVQLFNEMLREARLIGYDESTDIAVLQIPSGYLHPAVLADPAKRVNQGDVVFAFGSPFDFRFSMSSGIVSGRGRSVDVLGRDGYENFIQVDSAINPGNSGGPLTDYRGRVIGMNTAIATGRRSSLDEGQFAGIGLAIPLEMIVPVVTQIIEKGEVEKGVLGVHVKELNVGRAQRTFGLIGGGVLITSVDPGSPAEGAGLRKDDIVTAVHKEKVTTVPQLRSVISSMRPGDTVELSVFLPDRAEGAGDELTVLVRLDRLDRVLLTGRLPRDQPDDKIIPLGVLRMSTSTPALAERYGTRYREGVIIEEIAEGSPLQARMGPGDTIVAVGGESVRTTRELVELLRDYDLRQHGAPVGVFHRNGRPETIRLSVRP